MGDRALRPSVRRPFCEGVHLGAVWGLKGPLLTNIGYFCEPPKLFLGIVIGIAVFFFWSPL